MPLNPFNSFISFTSEVFATFAKLMVVNHDDSATPVYNGQEVKYIPNWAVGCSNEVIASGLLNILPNTDKVINDEYLSKEQVAYFVAAMKRNFQIDISNGAIGCATKYEPVAVKIKLSERISARTSNVNDTFTAKTTEEVTVDGKTFPTGSIVCGKVVTVQRPGLGKHPGTVTVKFMEIKNGDDVAHFPKQMTSATADKLNNPNIFAF